MEALSSYRPMSILTANSADMRPRIGPARPYLRSHLQLRSFVPHLKSARTFPTLFFRRTAMVLVGRGGGTWLHARRSAPLTPVSAAPQVS